MAKKTQPSQSNDIPHEDFDLLGENLLHDDITDKDIGDIIITTEESITVTLFDDAAVEEGEEDDFDTDLFGIKKKKTVSEDEAEGEDFDSYFFEE